MRFLVLVASLITLASCNWRTSPPADAPTGVTATPGDGLVLLSWDTQPDLTYWIFFQPGSSVTAATPGSIVIRNAISPRPVGGLANGTQYAFVMNATHSDSEAGPASPVVVATPRLGGENWVSGPSLTTQTLRAIAFNGSRLVVVGDAATIFAGDFNYGNSNPPGVSAWTPASSLPLGFTANLSAAVASGGFLAVGRDGSTINSPDGLTWASGTQIPGAGINAVTVGTPSSLTTFVAVGDGGVIFASIDGALTWITVPPITPNNLFGVSFINGQYVATGAAGTLLTSLDGRTWAAQTSNTGNALRGAAFANTAAGPRYVAVGDAGTVVTSPDAIAWAQIPSLFAENLNGVVFRTRFVAVGQAPAGQSARVAFSDDGVSWTVTSAGSSDLTSIVSPPSMYLAVGAAGANAVSR